MGSNRQVEADEVAAGAAAGADCARTSRVSEAPSSTARANARSVCLTGMLGRPRGRRLARDRRTDGGRTWNRGSCRRLLGRAGAPDCTKLRAFRADGGRGNQFRGGRRYRCSADEPPPRLLERAASDRPH